MEERIGRALDRFVSEMRLSSVGSQSSYIDAWQEYFTGLLCIPAGIAAGYGTFHALGQLDVPWGTKAFAAYVVGVAAAGFVSPIAQGLGKLVGELNHYRDFVRVFGKPGNQHF